MRNASAPEVTARYIRQNDTMTAGGQKSRTTDLPPATFRVNIPVMPMCVAGSHPYRMDAWRPFPTARLPGVGVTVPPVIAADPDMLSARAYRPVFPDADRGPKFYYDLSLSRYYPERKSKQCSKNEFSHSLLVCTRARWPATGEQRLYSHRRNGPCYGHGFDSGLAEALSGNPNGVLDDVPYRKETRQDRTFWHRLTISQKEDEPRR